VLCGLSFAAVIAAYAAVCQYDASFNYVQRFIITPLFLFGGAFYPIESLPVGLRPIAWITPLWHGVELCRGLSLHTMGLVTALGHLAVIAAYIVVGVAICRRLFIRRLYR
ncbi:MAG: ABC transporter permease, partial [Actinobacteria bacterium]|nr:ABC transporter permease [Actinomycetota bacterium]